MVTPYLSPSRRERIIRLFPHALKSEAMAPRLDTPIPVYASSRSISLLFTFALSFGNVSSADQRNLDDAKGVFFQEINGFRDLIY